VDFNKSCEEARGKFLPLSGRPVYYFYCGGCGFSFAPEFANWSEADFLKHIYNDEYGDIDPDYESQRPTANANTIDNLFGKKKELIRHLDYGGGNGQLSTILKSRGYDSTTYDPFPKPQQTIEELGTFNLITAFEVFEHVPDVHQLMGNLTKIMDPSGLVLFSTLVSDGQIAPNHRINWWYASPRNGHISLFSKKSLTHLAGSYQLNFGSFSDGFHCYVKGTQMPDWAKHLMH
jgi:hypothetical protein